MANGGSMTKKEFGESHDVLRFGVNDSVRAELAPPHPLQVTIQSENKFWDDKKKFGTEAIYGSAFNIRKDLDAQILSRFQRPPVPQDSDSLRIPDMHHGMEVRLGLSKGPVCPSFT